MFYLEEEPLYTNSVGTSVWKIYDFDECISGLGLKTISVFGTKFEDDWDYVIADNGEVLYSTRDYSMLETLFSSLDIFKATIS